MRSAERIGRTVGEYHDFAAAQRAKALRELLTMLRRAREDREPWYVWIEQGMPELTREEYEAQRSGRARGRRPARRDATVG